jgi:hypothetical protein
MFIVIWAGNRDISLIKEIRAALFEEHPEARINIRNADAYSGIKDCERVDFAFVQSKYPRIIADFRSLDIKVLTDNRRGEGTGKDPGDSPNQETPRSEVSDVAGVSVSEPSQESQPMGFENHRNKHAKRRGRKIHT